MQYSDYFVFFGAVSLLLGILGYVRGKSLPSLIAGGISGIGLVAAGIIAVKKGDPGFILGLVLSVLLLGRFLPAFLKKKQFYPAGIMALLSLGGVIAGIFALTAG